VHVFFVAKQTEHEASPPQASQPGDHSPPGRLSNAPPTVGEKVHKDEELDGAARKIQETFRSKQDWLLMRQKTTDEERRRAAAVKIQKSYRGCAVRHSADLASRREKGALPKSQSQNAAGVAVNVVPGSPRKQANRGMTRSNTINDEKEAGLSLNPKESKDAKGKKRITHQGTLELKEKRKSAIDEDIEAKVQAAGVEMQQKAAKKIQKKFRMSRTSLTTEPIPDALIAGAIPSEIPSDLGADALADSASAPSEDS
jgi:hypothetical protein